MKKGTSVIIFVLLIVLLWSLPVFSQGSVHTVQPGETLISIAARYGVTAQAIMSANGLQNPNFIYVGQKLNIPSGSGWGSGGAYTVQPGDTLTSVAQKFGTTTQALASANNLSNFDMIYVGQMLNVPGMQGGVQPPVYQCGSYHTVKAGDILSNIAWHYGVTVDMLKYANNLSNSDMIYVGQRLCIPGQVSIKPPIVKPPVKPPVKQCKSGCLPPPPPPSCVSAPTHNILVNGSFDAPWPDTLGVASGWKAFDNGQAHVGWYNDTWDKVVFDGDQAQMIEIVNDQGVGDRYAGIYQTVCVVPGAEYELVIHGLIRSDEGDAAISGDGYGLQYGIDYGGGVNWQSVNQWGSLPLPEYPREDPTSQNIYNYGTHTVRFRAAGPKLTLFIRGWKRWPDLNEVNFDVDAVSLSGVGCGCAQPACAAK